MLTGCGVVYLTTTPGCRIGTEGAQALAPSIQRLDQLIQLDLHGGYYSVDKYLVLGVIAGSVVRVMRTFRSACL